MQGEIPLHPSLALAYLAAVLREKGHNVAIIDAAAERMDMGNLVKKIETIRPEIIGITTNVGIYDKSVFTSRVLKNHFPNLPIIMDGPWANVIKLRYLFGLRS